MRGDSTGMQITSWSQQDSSNAEGIGCPHAALVPPIGFRLAWPGHSNTNHGGGGISPKVSPSIAGGRPQCHQHLEPTVLHRLGTPVRCGCTAWTGISVPAQMQKGMKTEQANRCVLAGDCWCVAPVSSGRTFPAHPSAVPFTPSWATVVMDADL